MTQLAHVQHAGVHRYQPADPVPDGVHAIEVWARTARAAGELVDQLLDSPFVPDAFRPRLDPRASTEEKEHARQVALATATAAVLYGGEIGLSPMQSLNNVIVINGRPGLYAETMVALVQAAGHEIWTEEVSDARAVVCGRRAGSAHVERAIFTMDRARKAGYTRNSKYSEDPQSMLYARAASIACRRTAPEVLKGVSAVEEIRDETAEEQPVKVTARRTAQRRALAPAPAAEAAPVREAAEAPPLPGEPGYDEPADEPADLDEPITDDQLTKLHTVFTEHGVGDREEKLDIARRVLRMPDLASSKSLTKAQASTLIDVLERAGRHEAGFSGFLSELLAATEASRAEA